MVGKPAVAGTSFVVRVAQSVGKDIKNDVWYTTDMIKNPYLNAFMALGYIALIILVIHNTSAIAANTPDTILAPVTMLSLFVLSAAIMGILFVYEPLRLFLENQKREALSFLLKTVGTFACFVLLLATLLFYTSLLK